MLIRIALPGLLLLPLVAGAQAVSPDSVRLAPVVVTASRTAEPLVTASATVSVLSGQALRDRGLTSVAEALREVPGLAIVASGPPGGTTSLFARGGNSNFVKVLIDGVAVNEAGGAFDFAHLDLTNVDRVEIARGPVSVLYGSDALAGVIQIFTKRGDVPGGSLEVRGGTGATVIARGDVSGTGFARWSAGASHHETSGLYAFNNSYRSTSASATFATLPRSPIDARLTTRIQRARYHFPTTGSGTPTDSNAFTDEQRMVAGVDVTRALPGPWSVAAALGFNQLDRLSDNSPDSPADVGGFYSRTDSRSTRQSSELRIRGDFTRVSLLAGGERVWQNETSDGTSRFAAFPPNTTHFNEQRASTGVYLQAVAVPGADIRVTAGLRRDDNDRFGTFDTWRVSAGWMALERVTLRAAAGTAFREPAFPETFTTSFSTGNPALRPERTRGWETGATLTLSSRARATATYFSQLFDNLIQYTGAFGSPAPSYENVAAASARGVELEAMAEGGAIFGALGATLLHTRVTDAGTGAGGTFVSGEQLLRRPERSGSLTVGYRRGFRVSATALHTGRRTDRDFNAFPARAVTLPPYGRLDAAASFPVGTDGAELIARVTNVTAARYQEIYGFRTAGLSIFLGARLGW